MTRLTGSLALLVTAALLAAGCGDGGTGDGGTDAPGAVGLLRVDAGVCDDDGVSAGSWFRMVQPDGTLGEGPFMPNQDSPCADNTWTPLSPGTDGGLRFGEYQPHPDPVFAEGGHGAAPAILEPQTFFAVRFAVATSPEDPQTGASVPAPALEIGDDGSVTGDLRAFGVAWNGEHFNQGAPKPDGSTPGATERPTGNYDAASGRIQIRWTSLIVGGPFDGFTGVWHLEGSLEPPT